MAMNIISIIILKTCYLRCFYYHLQEQDFLIFHIITCMSCMTAFFNRVLIENINLN